jgi:hypothetical protein
MATFVCVDELAEYLGTAQIHNDSHTFKAVITNTGPNQATDATLAGLTEIVSTGGYADATITGNAWTETGAGSGIWEFDCNPFSWTASGANFAEGRYIYIYDDTPTSPVADPLIGYLDYGSAFVVTDGNTLTVTPGANGVWRLTVS